MTAAQIRAAYELVERAALMDNEIVSLMEIGSEGAVLRFGNASMADAVLIARDGTYRARGASRAYLSGVTGEDPFVSVDGGNAGQMPNYHDPPWWQHAGAEGDLVFTREEIGLLIDGVATLVQSRDAPAAPLLHRLQDAYARDAVALPVPVGDETWRLVERYVEHYPDDWRLAFKRGNEVREVSVPEEVWRVFDS